MKKNTNLIFFIVLLVAMLSSMICVQAQENKVNTTEASINIENDSLFSYTLKRYAKSDVALGDGTQTFVIYRGFKSDPNFWYGTASLGVATAFYVAAAWSDPVVYVETHSYYTREYYDNAIKKRNVKIVGGTAFTLVAVYFYSRLRKKDSRWVIGPDGVKYSF